MAEAYIDAGTDTIYIERGGEYLVVPADGELGRALYLPGAASPLVNEDDISTAAYDEAYDEGYDAGYSDGVDQGYDSDELDAEYERGYEDGRSEAAQENDE